MFIKELGLENTPAEKLLQALQSVPTDVLQGASEATYMEYNPSVRWAFQPVIDGPGGFITTPPIQAWQEGRWHKIPILTGFNTNEGTMFVPQTMSDSSQFTSFFRTLLPGLSAEDLRVLNETYPDPLIDPSSKFKETRVHVGAQFYRVEQAYGHFGYIAPVRQVADFAATAAPPVYLYHFALKNDPIGGAAHGFHGPYATYSLNQLSSDPKNREVAGLMHACWASFIVKGDPNAIKGRFPDRPVWPKYAPRDGKLALFGADDEHAPSFGATTGSTMDVVDNSWMTEECAYWWARTKQFQENPPPDRFSSNL